MLRSGLAYQRITIAALALAMCSCTAPGTDTTTGDEANRSNRSSQNATTTTLPSSETITSGGSDELPTTSTSLVTAEAPEDSFVSAISEIDQATRDRMDGVSMHAGCPVGYDELRLLTLRARRLDGSSYDGELVVHRDVADDVVNVFHLLYQAHYPVDRMRLVDDFGPGATPMDGANDWRSIEANNTSAFNCRARTGSSTTYSEHSYGTAIDLNPLWNPYVGSSGTTSHPASVRFLDRSIEHPGAITPESLPVTSFEMIGWRWGGDWTSPKDYQHFSATGR